MAKNMIAKMMRARKARARKARAKKRKMMTLKSFDGEIFEAEERKKIILKSSDGVIFEVEEKVAGQSRILKFMIEDNCAYTCTIPVPNVTSDILDMVIEYCSHHAEVDDPGIPNPKANFYPEYLSDFDSDLVNDDDVDWDKLMLLIKAANYLDVPNLLALGCQEIVDRIERESLGEVRELFNIKTDFTPEEEAKLCTDHSWAFHLKTDFTPEEEAKLCADHPWLS